MDKIMIIEDDKAIYEELRTLLINNGYEVTDTLPCSLALLDINLPGESGYSICRKLREESNIPIIFLTARNTEEDELLGFAVGADDFIRKPYNSSILLARINRLLKRRDPSVLSCKGLTLEPNQLTCTYNGHSVELTRNEVKILTCLMSGKLCKREDIIDELWEDRLYIDDNTLNVNINRIREKLKSIGGEDLIKTVRGAGYRL